MVFCTVFGTVFCVRLRLPHCRARKNYHLAVPGSNTLAGGGANGAPVKATPMRGVRLPARHRDASWCRNPRSRMDREYWVPYIGPRPYGRPRTALATARRPGFLEKSKVFQRLGGG